MLSQNFGCQNRKLPSSSIILHSHICIFLLFLWKWFCKAYWSANNCCHSWYRFSIFICLIYVHFEHCCISDPNSWTDKLWKNNILILTPHGLAQLVWNVGGLSTFLKRSSFFPVVGGSISISIRQRHAGHRNSPWAALLSRALRSPTTGKGRLTGARKMCSQAGCFFLA